MISEVVALTVKQGESHLGIKNNVSKTLRRKGPGALRIQEPSQPRAKPAWLENKEGRRVICPEAHKGGHTDPAAPVGNVLDCSP